MLVGVNCMCCKRSSVKFENRGLRTPVLRGVPDTHLTVQSCCMNLYCSFIVQFCSTVSCNNFQIVVWIQITILCHCFTAGFLAPIHLELHPFFHVFRIFWSARLKGEIALQNCRINLYDSFIAQFCSTVYSARRMLRILVEVKGGGCFLVCLFVCLVQLGSTFA